MRFACSILWQDAHAQLDCASVGAAGAGMLFANNLYVGNTPGYQLKDADVAVVVCLRHVATVFAFNDDIWAK